MAVPGFEAHVGERALGSVALGRSSKPVGVGHAARRRDATMPGLVPQVTCGASVVGVELDDCGRSARRHRSAACASASSAFSHSALAERTGAALDDRRTSSRRARSCPARHRPRSTCCRSSCGLRHRERADGVAAILDDVAGRPPAPIWRMTPRMTSFAVTPGGELRRRRRRASSSACAAAASASPARARPRRCRCRRPARRTRRACEVWLSPQTIVMPGCVSPCSGPMTCTIPWRPLPRRVQVTPNSSQFCRSASTCAGESGS